MEPVPSRGCGPHGLASFLLLARPRPTPHPPGEETASVSALGSEADLRSELFLPLGHVTVTSCCWSGPSLPVGLSRASASSA